MGGADAVWSRGASSIVPLRMRRIIYGYIKLGLRVCQGNNADVHMVNLRRQELLFINQVLR